MSKALRIKTGNFGRVALLDMDSSLVRHAHPHCHVLFKIDGADTRFLVGENIAELTDEQAVLVNAWTPHSYVRVPEAPRTLILALYIEPVWLAQFRANWLAAQGAGFFGHNVGQITPKTRNLVLGLALSMVHAPTAIAEHERLLGELMITVIERFTEWRSVGTTLRATAPVQSVDWRVRKAIDIIRATLGQIDVVERLAEGAGMSRANFFRVFENSTGVSPRVFMNVVRLEQAVHASINTDMSFGELSERQGFSSQGHFTRFFRNHTGVAPSHFRATVRSGDIAETFRL